MKAAFWDRATPIRSSGIRRPRALPLWRSTRALFSCVAILSVAACADSVPTEPVVGPAVVSFSRAQPRLEVRIIVDDADQMRQLEFAKLRSSPSGNLVSDRPLLGDRLTTIPSTLQSVADSIARTSGDVAVVFVRRSQTGIAMSRIAKQNRSRGTKSTTERVPLSEIGGDSVMITQAAHDSAVLAIDDEIADAEALSEYYLIEMEGEGGGGSEAIRAAGSRTAAAGVSVVLKQPSEERAVAARFPLFEITGCEDELGFFNAARLKLIITTVTAVVAIGAVATTVPVVGWVAAANATAAWTTYYATLTGATAVSANAIINDGIDGIATKNALDRCENPV